MARQSLAAIPKILETAGRIGSRLTEPKLHLATLNITWLRTVMDKRLSVGYYQAWKTQADRGVRGI